MFDASVREAIIRVADANHLDPAKLMAVVFVESGGIAYWDIDGDRLPPIRYEGHYAYRYVTKNMPHRLKEAMNLGLVSAKVGGVKNPTNYKARYALFKKACEFDLYMAIWSTSFGVGQVMGSNYIDLGYSKIQDLMLEATDSVEGQVILMVKFIKHNKLDRALNAGDWKTFAKRYNGPSYAMNRYDVRMAEAYKQFAKYGPQTNTDPMVVNPETRVIQQKLSKLGYYTGFVDGKEGPATRRAIVAFQRDNGLTADGIAGPMTMEEIEHDLKELENKAAPTSLGLKAGVGAISLGGVQQVYDAVSDTHDAATKVYDIFSMANAPKLAGIVIVGAIVGYVVYRGVKHVLSKYKVVRASDVFDD